MNLLFLFFHFARLFTLCYILQVGPTYGRKMMAGNLRQKLGTAIGQNCTGGALAKVHPGNHRKRQNKSARQTNPIPYRADYFSHKLHLDQNEKLIMYGVTHVVAIYGHSRFVVAACTSPIKNNILIFDQIYR